MHTLDPDTLRTFLAVAEAPSFAEAGQRVNKTQSTVSMQMRRLEETLGIRLFRKAGRRNVLTHEGRELLDYAARIVRLNDEAVGRFAGPRLTGRIRIGTPDDYAETFLPEIFGRFAATHPTVEVGIVCRSSEHLVELVEAGELDVAIVTMNTRYRRARVLMEEALVWTGSPDRPIEEARPLPIAVWQPGCAWRSLTLAALDGAEIPYRIAYVGGSGVALGLTVRAGLAVAAMPRRFVRHGLREIPEDGTLPRLGTLDIGMVTTETERTDVVDAFACHVTQCFETFAGAAPDQPAAAPPPAAPAEA